MRIFTCGSASLISVAASMPDFLGMRTSMRITSGMSSCARSTTSSPSDASPTSSRSGSASRTICSPRRNSAWSSQTRIRRRSRVCWRSSLTSPPDRTGGVAVRALVGALNPLDLRGCYRPAGTREHTCALLLVVVPDLPFDALDHHVERRLHARRVAVRPIGLARRDGDDLDAVRPTLPRVVLGDHLDVQADELGLEPLEARELAVA